VENRRREISQKLVAAIVVANAHRYVSLAPTDAVAGAAHSMAARLWNLPMGLAVVEAPSLEARSYRGVPLCEVSHLTVESSAGVGEVK